MWPFRRVNEREVIIHEIGNAVVCLASIWKTAQKDGDLEKHKDDFQKQLKRIEKALRRR